MFCDSSNFHVVSFVFSGTPAGHHRSPGRRSSSSRTRNLNTPRHARHGQEHGGAISWLCERCPANLRCVKDMLLPKTLPFTETSGSLERSRGGGRRVVCVVVEGGRRGRREGGGGRGGGGDRGERDLNTPPTQEELITRTAGHARHVTTRHGH